MCGKSTVAIASRREGQVGTVWVLEIFGVFGAFGVFAGIRGVCVYLEGPLARGIPQQEGHTGPCVPHSCAVAQPMRAAENRHRKGKRLRPNARVC